MGYHILLKIFLKKCCKIICSKALAPGEAFLKSVFILVKKELIFL